MQNGGNMEEKAKIKIMKDGPYVVTGNVPLSEKKITPVGRNYIYEEGRNLPQAPTYALCRCGKTKTPPFCDGMHAKEHFDGTETASRAPFLDRCKRYDGPTLLLLDDERCAFARFCHTERGDAWDLTEQSDDPECRERAIKAATECPAGRLDIIDKLTGETIEPQYTPSIEVLQDPDRSVSCGLFVKGGIPIEATDGALYETRNRVVLCRCGYSRIKPFCDSMHIIRSYSDKRNGGLSSRRKFTIVPCFIAFGRSKCVFTASDALLIKQDFTGW